MVPSNDSPYKKKLHVNRLRSLKCAKVAIDTGSIEQFRVWKVNAAGVLVENRDISGFIPLSLLGEVHTARVLAEEKYLKQQEKEKMVIEVDAMEEDREEGSDGVITNTSSSSSGGGGGGSSGDDEKEGTEEDTLVAKKKKSKSDLRKKAMSVMMGRTVLGMVLDIDRVEGRVLISERAALKTWGKKPPPPKEELLNGALNMVGKGAVQGMVIKVKPFGCFVEFVVAASDNNNNNNNNNNNSTNDERRSGSRRVGGGRKEFLEKGTTLIGLVHASRLGCENGVCPTDFIGMGTKVEVYVERVDMKKMQVFLSMLKREEEEEETVVVVDGGTTAVGGSRNE
jgi:ribosomal protein S1